MPHHSGQAGRGRGQAQRRSGFEFMSPASQVLQRHDARNPAWDEALAQPLTLSARINACQVQHVPAAALAPQSDGLP